MPRYAPILLILIVLAAAGLFRIKNAVVAAEGEIARLERSIESERRRLSTLEADRAYLTRAERLVPQAAALGMVPTRPERLVATGQIAYRDRLELARIVREVMLPSGDRVALRARPAMGFDVGVLAPGGALEGGGW